MDLTRRENYWKTLEMKITLQEHMLLREENVQIDHQWKREGTFQAQIELEKQRCLITMIAIEHFSKTVKLELIKGLDQQLI